MSQSQANPSIALPFAAEAAWVTGKWDKLAKLLSHTTDTVARDFNVGIGSAMLALKDNDSVRFTNILHGLRQSTAGSLTPTTTASLQACHDAMLKLHVLAEVEAMSGARFIQENGRPMSMGTLNQRLNVLGAFLSDKQYLLGIRRAVMQLSGYVIPQDLLQDLTVPKVLSQRLNSPLRGLQAPNWRVRVISPIRLSMPSSMQLNWVMTRP